MSAPNIFNIENKFHPEWIITFQSEVFQKYLLESGKTPEEVEILLTFADRERFAHKFFTDRTGNSWKVRPYQRDSLCSYSSRKLLQCGRDVGKTAEIEIFLIWASMCYENREGLLAVQLENHLVPTMERIISRIQDVPDFASSLISIQRKPSYRLVFKNKFILWGKIAGPRGANFQNTHVDFCCIDEGQNMADIAWGELYQAINHGGWQWVYGVPNGIRNQFYRLSNEKIEIHNWPSTINPDFTEERRQELIRLYGGEDSPGYIHQVLGLHGAPAEGVFDADAYTECVERSLEHFDIVLKKSDLEEFDYTEIFNLPKPPEAQAFFFGADLGYAQDPTEIVGWYSTGSKLAAFLRVSFRGVPYNLQQEVIFHLYKKYRFAAMGIDRGASGQAVIDNLIAEHPEMGNVIMRGSDGGYGYAFGSNFLVGYNDDGVPQFRPIKQFMTDLLKEGLYKKRFILSNCSQREEQYINHSYRYGPQGQIVYSKGNDHILDADRTSILAWYQTMYPHPHIEPIDPGVVLEGI